MGTSFRNHQRVPTDRRKLNCMPLAIGGRVATKIHCNIPNTTTNTSHKLGFSIWRSLEMETTDSAYMFRTTQVDLNY